MSESTPQDSKTSTKDIPTIAYVVVGVVALVVVLWFGSFIPFGTANRGDVIAGMSADDITMNLEQRGFTIDKDYATDTAICKRDRYTVEVQGIRGYVLSVRLTIDVDTSSGSPTFAFDDRKLMGYIASTSYDGANSAENIHWAELHFESPAKRSDKQTVFETTNEPTKRTLIIRAAGKDDLATAD